MSQPNSLCVGSKTTLDIVTANNEFAQYETTIT